MITYIQPLLDAFRAHADPAQAAPMARYMRDQFPFFGLKAPQRRALERAFVADHGLPPVEQAADVVRALWAQPERECQYAAQSLLYRLRRQLPADSDTLLAELVTTKSWWDTVDMLAGRNVAAHFQRFPGVGAAAVSRWRRSDNFWLRRTTLLYQLHYKEKTDVELLWRLIEENAADSEFFIRKAIGWALREYSKTDAAAVVDFVARTPLSPLSEREALKWLRRRGVVD